MDVAPKPGGLSSTAKYAIAAALVILVLLAVFFSIPSQGPTTSTIQETGPTTSVSSTNVSNPTNSTTTIPIPAVYAHVQLYCIGGTNSSGAVSSSYFTNIYNNTPGITFWEPATPYPLAVQLASCTSYENTMYCIGGQYPDVNQTLQATNSTYYSTMVQFGNTTWNASTPYPDAVRAASCVTYLGYVYCIGGANNTGYPVPSNYYAPINSSGIGNWTPTASYPANVYFQSCATYAGYVYCVGGWPAPSNVLEDMHLQPVSSVYYAQLTPNGLSGWQQTTSYPYNVSNTACTAWDGYLYCVGEDPSSRANLSYIAPILNQGIGSWLPTSAFPLSTRQATECLTKYGNIYCIGASKNVTLGVGSVYSSPLNITGEFKWQPQIPYYAPTSLPSCIVG